MRAIIEKAKKILADKVKIPADVCPYQYLGICKSHQNQENHCSILQQAEIIRETEGNNRDFHSYQRAYRTALTDISSKAAISGIGSLAMISELTGVVSIKTPYDI